YWPSRPRWAESRSVAPSTPGSAPRCWPRRSARCCSWECIGRIGSYLPQIKRHLSTSARSPVEMCRLAKSWTRQSARLIMRGMRPDLKLFGVMVCLAWGTLARGAVAAEEANAIYVMRPDGGEVRMVARVGPLHAHKFPRWSHDGKRLTFEVLPLGT